MSNHNRILAAATLAAAVLASGPAQAQGWQGRYTYEEPLGRDAVGKGISIFVTHRLTIGPDGYCRIDAQGYQTDNHILCTATPAGGTLQVKFLGYVGGGVKNQFGVQIYRPMQPLFRLTRGPRGLTTAFQGYQLQHEGAVGRFFRRA